jgi:serine phosphatase RsbU (regulator of sigma subunit)
MATVDSALPGDQDVAGQSAGEVLLGSLLEEARHLHPEQLLPTLRARAEAVGLRDLVIYLVDRDQRVLTPLGNASMPVEQVDGSMAGRCYQRTELLLAEEETTSRHAWLPLLDGNARWGVMRVSLDEADSLSVARAERLAALAGYVISAKAVVSDEIVGVINAQPLTLAAEIRWAALPPLAFDNPVVSVGASLQPAYEIAGDTFDYAVEGDKLHLAVFDAMGHGLQASALANLAVYAYRAGRRQGLTLEEIYHLIDGTVNEQFGDECFVTAQLATIDLLAGSMRSISAGHPHPLLLRDRTHIRELAAVTSLPIGMGGRDIEVTEQQLQPGDTLIYYSDGISEARSPGGEQYGLERLQELLVRAVSSGLTPAEIARRALHAVMKHHDEHLDDDASLVLATWLGKGA